MDSQKLADLLRGTIDPHPEQRLSAERQLTQIHKIIGFVPTILQIVMQNNIDPPVRQAGAIYLKNMIISHWCDPETKPGEPLMNFSIHEQDRAMIRGAIVDAVVHAPELIKYQLGICVMHIIKADFPGRWPQVVDSISIHLQNPDPNSWNGALYTMYQLVKTYEYKRAEDRSPLNEALNLLLPMLYTLMLNLLNDPSEQSVLMQKQILKIYHALTQYSLPLELITKEIFAQWMEICRRIAERIVPECPILDDDEKPEFPWWKCKKWAWHIMVRMFERYGSPGNVISDKYTKFAQWYLVTFTTGVLEVLMATLDQYRNQVYVSPRVLSDCLAYLGNAVGHAYSWKLIKPHIGQVVSDVIFPIMSFTDADQELWEDDPHEYIRVKFGTLNDIFEDYATPVPAAQTLLNTLCKKRKGILDEVIKVIMQVISSGQADDKQKDGAFHMIGTVANVMLKKRMYLDQVENMLTTFVFPEFNSPSGHMRARACWVLYYFVEIPFSDPRILSEIMRLTKFALLNDKELPVKVEAAIAIQIYVGEHPEAARCIVNDIKDITKELLTIIRETENEDLTNILQKFVCTFTAELVPVAMEICEHLANTFSQVLESEEGSEDKAITAMGLLNTIETLLNVMDDHPDVIVNLHPIVINVVGHIFQHKITEFYEETFSLVYELTTKRISPEMWHMFELIYQVFREDGTAYFVDMMPALHNYVIVDTEQFLANPGRLMAMYHMCKTMLTTYPGEDPECHAAKLLEVIILQCRGKIDSVMQLFVELPLSRLTREVQSSELRTMCLQVVIAALYYNCDLCVAILDGLPNPPNESIFSHFVKQWLHDADCFLGIHDRKMCVLGLCTLIALGELKPPVLFDVADQIIPAFLLLFDGLRRAYESRAQEEEEEEDDDDDDDDDDDYEEALSSDDDDINPYSQNYLESIADMTTSKTAEAGMAMTAEIKEDSDSDGEEEESLGDLNETPLEAFATSIDERIDDPTATVNEFVTFRGVLAVLQHSEKLWYEKLIAKLTPEQLKSLEEVMKYAKQHEASLDSKRIEKQGGFSFTQQNVPTSFRFG